MKSGDISEECYTQIAQWKILVLHGCPGMGPGRTTLRPKHERPYF